MFEEIERKDGKLLENGLTDFKRNYGL